MAHQTQLEKAKYRCWVKGALSMKYLRDGLEKFTDVVVQKEHTRILQQVGITTGQNCTGCSLRDLKPVHTSVYNSTTKRKSCPRGQNNCNCLYPNKRSCPNKICGAIYEEILNTHASSPPSPFLKNTDITKWATNPWEVAKCFINAPGYRDRQCVEEIDLAGLLHVFINNTMLQTSLSCLISGDKRDAFCKILDLRNKIFHSSVMELEEQDLSTCFRNIVTILEDEKNLKHTQCAKEAVKLIKQLDNQDFIITTEKEAMALRDITEQMFNKLEESDIELAKGQSELIDKQNQMEHRQSDLEHKHLELAKVHAELDVRHNVIENRQSIAEQKHLELAKGHAELDVRHNETEKRQSGLEQKHLELTKVQAELDRKHNETENRQSIAEQKHLGLAEGHSELEKKHNKLEKRLEQKQTELDQRLAKAETELKDLHKNKLMILKNRLDARKKLANHLQKHYVKTSASPLKTRENEIEISKVYVEPKIEIIKIESTENKKNKDSSDDMPTFVENYSSIFHSHGKRLRRIYLLGKVGSGKSAFCKMMIYNWCRTVTQQIDQVNGKDELENIEAMKQFDFLFFLPLRRLQGNGRIGEMIHRYYKDLIPKETLDDILLNEPEKCIILADGLDEWAPNSDEQRPLHVTDGLPYLEDIDDVTVLTTSRPSAPGVLNMAFTESDQKLVVEGIHSIELMAEKYMLFISDPKGDSKCILDHLYAIEIFQLDKSPLLLQQLVWMLGNGFEVGKCMSNIYSSLVNIALKWTEEKCSKKKIKSVWSCNNSIELHLPKQLMKYDACQANRNILFTLGKIAFELLVPENTFDSQMSFGRVKLNEDGLNDEMIDTLLSVGLLTEDNCYDNIEQRTQFAFAHVSFQEYFAALYIASYSKTAQNRFPHAPERIARELLIRLFGRFCPVQNILQFGVVLQILCGLSPEIIHDVCEHVYQIAHHDPAYSNLRDTFLLKQSNMWFDDKYVSITLDIQTLIASCILEYNFNEERSLHVSPLPVLDLFIMSLTKDQYSELLQYINPQRVLHLSLYRDFDIYEEDVRTFISDVVFQNLQTIAIEWFGDDDTNLFTDAVNQHLLKTLSVRRCKILSILGNKIFSFLLNECVLDLSGHHQIELVNTNYNVEIVDIKNIEVIILATRNISPIIQRGVPPKLRHLEVCEVTMVKRELIEFAMFISGVVLIKVLKLNRISCSVDNKPSNVTLIDLSSHDSLRVLEIEGVDLTSITSVNTTNLQTVITDMIDVLHAVRTAKKLIHLNFSGRIPFTVPYTQEMNEDVCSCSQLQEIELKHVIIQDEALEMSCGMRNLKCIKLNTVIISLPDWIRFVDSLLKLKQSVTVILNLDHVVENINEVFNYITENNKTFDLKKDWRGVQYLSFETLR